MDAKTRHKLWSEKNQEHLKEYKRQWQIDNKERIAAQRKANRKHINKVSRAYWNTHKDRKAELDKKYRESHKEEIAAYKKKWYLDHRDEHLAKCAENYQANKEPHRKASKKFYRVHRASELVRLKEWKQQNPDKVYSYKVKRNAITRNSAYTLTKSQIKRIQAAGCLFCGSKENLTIAHDTPVSKGGNTTWGNAFCLCQSHNSQMHTKSLSDLFVQQSLNI